MNSSNDLYPNTDQPSLFWRVFSHQQIFAAGAISRIFLFAFNRTEVNGLPRFLDLLRSRSDHETRQRGLLTVSNHVSVIDDPLIWGALPFSFTAVQGYMNHRWSLASHDICFTNPFLAHFFTLGQTLPTHRQAHSQYGGISQPTMTEAVRILSRISATKSSWSPNLKTSCGPEARQSSYTHDCVDPFSEVVPAPSYSSYPHDSCRYLAPSRYACNSFSWIHIFPEGMIHQSPQLEMRYFKWGVARLILEPPECPDVVPMFIEGTDQIMHESREFPRFLPRIGKTVSITFGQAINTEATFGDLRERWRILEAHARPETIYASLPTESVEASGVLSGSLINGEEAVELRKECTRRLRQEVLKVRRSRGHPDEDPKAGLAETFIREGPKREGHMADDTWVKDA